MTCWRGCSGCWPWLEVRASAWGWRAQVPLQQGQGLGQIEGVHGLGQLACQAGIGLLQGGAQGLEGVGGIQVIAG